VSDYQIFNVEYRDDVASVPVYCIDYTKPDGTHHRHITPPEALAWRAAEYDIDPADVDTLIDIIVHEVFIPDPTKPWNRKTDAAVKKGMLRKGGAPVTLANSTSAVEAREAHMARIEEVKKTRNITKASATKLQAMKKPADADVFAVIRKRGVDPTVVQSMRVEVQKMKSALLNAPPPGAAPQPKGATGPR